MNLLEALNTQLDILGNQIIEPFIFRKERSKPTERTNDSTELLFEGILIYADARI
jgi:hypothetical protein